MKIYNIQFVNPKGYVNDAAVFSADKLDDEIADALRKAQEVIEGQWLANYTPQFYCILLLPEDLKDVGFQLYDKVRLIHLDDWDTVINASEVVLVNSHLFSLLHTDESPFFTEISNLSAKTLINLSEDSTVIVAGLTNVQQAFKKESLTCVDVRRGSRHRFLTSVQNFSYRVFLTRMRLLPPNCGTQALQSNKVF